jgi:hypothetical protein
MDNKQSFTPKEMKYCLPLTVNVPNVKDGYTEDMFIHVKGEHIILESGFLPPDGVLLCDPYDRMDSICERLFDILPNLSKVHQVNDGTYLVFSGGKPTYEKLDTDPFIGTTFTTIERKEFYERRTNTREENQR